MTLKRPQGAPGAVVTLEHVSRVLADNPLGDPHVRKVSVWLPPQYDQGRRDAGGRRFPVLFDLVGFTGSGSSHLNWKPFEENVMAVRLLARLARENDKESARYRAAIGLALRSIATPDAVKERGRILGDFLLALEETRGVR